MSETVNFLMQRIEALEQENKRLNNELIKFKELALETTLSDSTFSSPEQIEVNYQLVTPN